MANLVVRLCDVHPSGESLRVSYGVLNLTHRDGHEKPALLAIGRALPRAHPAQRCRLGVSGRPPGEACAIHGLLADDLALSGEGDAADFWRHARSAGTPARGRTTRCCRRCPARSRRHRRSRRCIRRGDMRIERIDRIGLELGAQGKSQYHVEEDDPLSAVGRAAADADDVAGRLANPHRDANAAVLHARCLPAGGELARVGRRAGSLPSRMGSRHCSRLSLTTAALTQAAARRR